jgi:transcription elongation GreA/GreB family factor
MDDDDAPRLRLDGKLYMTPTGLAQLREELTTLMNVERPRVVNVVSWAAANGIAAENADYQYGKRRLSEIDRRARFLVKRIEDAIAPIATALIKARARRGDEVAVHTPRGEEIIEVLSVSYPSPAAPYEDTDTMGPVGSVSEPLDHRTEQGAHAVPGARRDE